MNCCLYKLNVGFAVPWPELFSSKSSKTVAQFNLFHGENYTPFKRGTKTDISVNAFLKRLFTVLHNWFFPQLQNV